MDFQPQKFENITLYDRILELKIHHFFPFFREFKKYHLISKEMGTFLTHFTDLIPQNIIYHSVELTLLFKMS